MFNPFTRFRGNVFCSFCVILPTTKPMDGGEHITCLVEVIMIQPAGSVCVTRAWSTVTYSAVPQRITVVRTLFKNPLIRWNHCIWWHFPSLPWTMSWTHINWLPAITWHSQKCTIHAFLVKFDQIQSFLIFLWISLPFLFFVSVTCS